MSNHVRSTSPDGSRASIVVCMCLCLLLSVVVSSAVLPEETNSGVLSASTREEPLVKAESAGPDLEVDEVAHDFGCVDDRKKLEHVFKLTNVGTEDLIVSKVRPTCGCTVVSLSDATIPPGGMAQMEVVVDPAGRLGDQIFEVYVHSNDPATPLVQLSLSAIVVPERVLASPRTVIFDGVKAGHGATCHVYLFDPGGTKLQIDKVVSDSPLITTQFVSVGEDEDHPRYRVTLSLKPGAPVGEFKSKVTIFTNHPKEPRLEIPVAALIKSDLEVYPGMISFGIVKHGENVQRSVCISTAGEAPLKIERIENPFGFISIEVCPKVEGKEYSVKADLRNIAPAGTIDGDIIIHTNNSEQREIKVPVYGLVDGG